MKIIITGGSGQLGTELQDILASGRADIGPIDGAYSDALVVSTDSRTLDIADSSAVDEYLSQGDFDYLINCAAATNVDGCEADPAFAQKVNGEGPENLARACDRYGVTLVHVSTDYVFDGSDPHPRVETDECEPRSVYGKTKLAGELAVEGECGNHYIFRTAWLYGSHGKNFVRTVLKVAQTGGPMTVVDDQVGSPTNANDLAYEILKVMLTGEYGVYHCTGEGQCSWFDFTQEIVRLAGLDMAVLPCSSDEYAAAHPLAARRPAFSILDNRHLRETVGNQMRPWREALCSFIDLLRTRGEIL